MTLDLSTLPKPKLIEELDYEAFLAARKSEFLNRLTADMRATVEPIIDLETEPLNVLLQESAYRELVLRNRINEVALAVTLAYAEDSDLDHLASRYEVERLIVTPANPNAIPPIDAVYEDDTSLRRRTQMAFNGLSTAGPEDAYIFHALSASGLVRDATAISHTGGHVTVYLLSRETGGVAGQTLIAAASAYLSDKKRRPLCDTVSVEPCELVHYNIQATIYIQSGPSEQSLLASINAELDSYKDKAYMLGSTVARSWIDRCLHQASVKRAVIQSPASDLMLDKHQAAICDSVSISVVVEND